MIKLQFCKGRIEALVKESPSKGKDLKLTFPDVGLDKDFDYQIKLADGRLVHGFLCEAYALAAARDISHFGGWRAYLESL